MQSQTFYKKMAEHMAEKKGRGVGGEVSFLSHMAAMYFFFLIKSTLLCLRGT